MSAPTCRSLALLGVLLAILDCSVSHVLRSGSLPNKKGPGGKPWPGNQLTVKPTGSHRPQHSQAQLSSLNSPVTEPVVAALESSLAHNNFSQVPPLNFVSSQSTLANSQSQSIATSNSGGEQTVVVHSNHTSWNEVGSTHPPHEDATSPSLETVLSSVAPPPSENNMPVPVAPEELSSDDAVQATPAWMDSEEAIAPVDDNALPADSYSSVQESPSLEESHNSPVETTDNSAPQTSWLVESSGQQDGSGPTSGGATQPPPFDVEQVLAQATLLFGNFDPDQVEQELDAELVESGVEQVIVPLAAEENAPIPSPPFPEASSSSSSSQSAIEITGEEVAETPEPTAQQVLPPNSSPDLPEGVNKPEVYHQPGELHHVEAGSEAGGAAAPLQEPEVDEHAPQQPIQYFTPPLQPVESGSEFIGGDEFAIAGAVPEEEELSGANPESTADSFGDAQNHHQTVVEESDQGGEITSTEIDPENIILDTDTVLGPVEPPQTSSDTADNVEPLLGSMEPPQASSETADNVDTVLGPMEPPQTSSDTADNVDTVLGPVEPSQTSSDTADNVEPLLASMEPPQASSETADNVDTVLGPVEPPQTSSETAENVDTVLGPMEPPQASSATADSVEESDVIHFHTNAPAPTLTPSEDVAPMQAASELQIQSPSEHEQQQQQPDHSEFEPQWSALEQQQQAESSSLTHSSVQNHQQPSFSLADLSQAISGMPLEALGSSPSVQSLNNLIASGEPALQILSESHQVDSDSAQHLVTSTTDDTLELQSGYLVGVALQPPQIHHNHEATSPSSSAAHEDDGPNTSNNGFGDSGIPVAGVVSSHQIESASISHSHQTSSSTSNQLLHESTIQAIPYPNAAPDHMSVSNSDEESSSTQEIILSSSSIPPQPNTPAHSGDANFDANPPQSYDNNNNFQEESTTSSFSVPNPTEEQVSEELSISYQQTDVPSPNSTQGSSPAAPPPPPLAYEAEAESAGGEMTSGGEDNLDEEQVPTTIYQILSGPAIPTEQTVLSSTSTYSNENAEMINNNSPGLEALPLPANNIVPPTEEEVVAHGTEGVQQQEEEEEGGGDDEHYPPPFNVEQYFAQAAQFLVDDDQNLLDNTSPIEAIGYPAATLEEAELDSAELEILGLQLPQEPTTLEEEEESEEEAGNPVQQNPSNSLQLDDSLTGPGGEVEGDSGVVVPPTQLNMNLQAEEAFEAFASRPDIVLPIAYANEEFHSHSETTAPDSGEKEPGGGGSPPSEGDLSLIQQLQQQPNPLFHFAAAPPVYNTAQVFDSAPASSSSLVLRASTEPRVRPGRPGGGARPPVMVGGSPLLYSYSGGKLNIGEELSFINGSIATLSSSNQNGTFSFQEAGNGNRFPHNSMVAVLGNTIYNSFLPPAVMEGGPLGFSPAAPAHHQLPSFVTSQAHSPPLPLSSGVAALLPEDSNSITVNTGASHFQSHYFPQDSVKGATISISNGNLRPPLGPLFLASEESLIPTLESEITNVSPADESAPANHLESNMLALLGDQRKGKRSPSSRPNNKPVINHLDKRDSSALTSPIITTDEPAAPAEKAASEEPAILLPPNPEVTQGFENEPVVPPAPERPEHVLDKSPAPPNAPPPSAFEPPVVGPGLSLPPPPPAFLPPMPETISVPGPSALEVLLPAAPLAPTMHAPVLSGDISEMLQTVNVNMPMPVVPTVPSPPTGESSSHSTPGVAKSPGRKQPQNTQSSSSRPAENAGNSQNGAVVAASATPHHLLSKPAPTPDFERVVELHQSMMEAEEEGEESEDDDEILSSVHDSGSAESSSHLLLPPEKSHSDLPPAEQGVVEKAKPGPQSPPKATPPILPSSHIEKPCPCMENSKEPSKNMIASPPSPSPVLDSVVAPPADSAPVNSVRPLKPVKPKRPGRPGQHAGSKSKPKRKPVIRQESEMSPEEASAKEEAEAEIDVNEDEYHNHSGYPYDLEQSDSSESETSTISIFGWEIPLPRWSTFTDLFMSFFGKRFRTRSGEFECDVMMMTAAESPVLRNELEVDWLCEADTGRASLGKSDESSYVCNTFCTSNGFHSGVCMPQRSCLCYMTEENNFAIKLDRLPAHLYNNNQTGDNSSSSDKSEESATSSDSSCDDCSCLNSCKANGKYIGYCTRTCYCGNPFYNEHSSSKNVSPPRRI